MNGAIHFLIRDSLDGGFEAQSLNESIFTKADSYDLLKEAIRDAIVCHFSDQEIPQMIHLHYVKDEVIAV